MKWAAVVVACAACNQTYGLDETSPQDAFEQFADKDQDGIADGADNCPAVANADQLDDDRDGVGDACDHCDACQDCAVGPDHDEDGDKIPDGCDPCPQAPGACDIGARQIVQFDGFGSEDPAWLEDGPRWAVESDAVHPAPEVVSSASFFLQYAMPGPVGATWFIEAQVTTPTVGNGVALWPRGNTGGDPNCLLTNPTPALYRLAGASQVVVNNIASLPPTVTLRMSPSADGITCELVGLPYKGTATGVPLSYPLTVRLYATDRVVQFSYVLAVQ